MDKSWNRRSFISMLGVGAVGGAGLFNAGKSLDLADQLSTVDWWGGSWDQSAGGLPAAPISVLQGVTDFQSAQFSVVAEQSVPLRFQILTPNNESLETSSIQILFKPILRSNFSPYVIYKFNAIGLNPATQYRLDISDGNDQLLDSRFFKTFPKDASQFRFSVLSCLCDLVYNDGNWSALEQKNPEMIFLIGDSAYLDFTSWTTRKAADIKQGWERHVAARMKFRLYFQRHLIPVLAVWDDHDFGQNNAGRDFPYKDDTLFLFKSFFAQDDDNQFYKKGPILASSFQYAGQKFILLENRYHRMSETSKEPGFFGSEQTHWLLNEMKKDTRPCWLMQGSQWFGEGHRGENSAMEAQCKDVMMDLFSEIRRIGNRMALISGDVHYSEIQRIEPDFFGYSTLEITSSSMHSWTAPGWDWLNRNGRRIASSNRHNFVMIASQLLNDGIKGTVESWTSGPRRLFSHPFEIS